MKNETKTNVNADPSAEKTVRKANKRKKKFIILGAIVAVVAIVIASISISNNAKEPQVEIMGMYVDESYDDGSRYALYVLFKMMPEESEDLVLSNSSVEIDVNGNKYQDSYIDYTDKAIDEGCYDHRVYQVFRTLKFAQLPKELDEEEEIYAGDTTPRYYATKFMVSKYDIDNGGKIKFVFYPCYAIDMLNVCIKFNADVSEILFKENADAIGKHLYNNCYNSGNLAEGAVYLTREAWNELYY